MKHLLAALLLFSCWTSMAETLSVIGHGREQQPAPPHRWYDYCEETTKGTYPTVVNYLFKQHGYSVTYISTVEQHPNYVSQVNSEIQLVINEQVDFIPVPQIMAKDSRLTATKVPLLIANTVLITHKNKDIYRLNELNHRKGEIGQFSNTLHQKHISRLTPRPKLIDNLEDALIRLNTGKIDYIISGEYISVIAMRTLGINKNLRIIDTALPPNSFYLATKKGGRYDSKIKELEHSIENMRKSGSINRMHESNAYSWIRNSDCALH